MGLWHISSHLISFCINQDNYSINILYVKTKKITSIIKIRENHSMSDETYLLCKYNHSRHSRPCPITVFLRWMDELELNFMILVLINFFLLIYKSILFFIFFFFGVPFWLFVLLFAVGMSIMWARWKTNSCFSWIRYWNQGRSKVFPLWFHWYDFLIFYFYTIFSK